MSLAQKLPWRLLSVGLILGLVGHFQVSYILSILNPAELVFHRFIDDSFARSYNATLGDGEWRLLWTCVINTALLAFLLCCLLMPVLAERFGRLACFWMGAAGVALGSAASASAKGARSFQLYTLGRFVAAFFAMLATSVLPLFLTEISTKQQRGLVNVATGAQTQVASLVASLLAMPNVLGTDQFWPVIHWLEVVPCFVAAAALPFCYESPKYLMARGVAHTTVADSLRFYQGSEANVAQQMVEVEKEILLSADRLSVWAALRHVDARRGMLVGAALNAAIGVNGHVAGMFFATHVLREAGLSDLHASLGNLLIVFVGVVGSFAALPTLDRLGRRTLLLWGYAITWVAMAVVWAALWLHERGAAPWTAAVVMAGFGVHRFLAGLATLNIPFFVTTEMVPQNARSACQGVAVAARYVTLPLGAAVFFQLEGLVGSWSMLMFVAPLGFINAYLYFALPETKVRDVSEVLQAFDELPKASVAMRKITTSLSFANVRRASSNRPHVERDAVSGAAVCEPNVTDGSPQCEEGSTDVPVTLTVVNDDD